MNFSRAVLAFVALPGTVAFVADLLWCVRSFYVEGKGTLALRGQSTSLDREKEGRRA